MTRGTLPCPAEDEEEKDLDLAYGDDKDDDDRQGAKQALENPSINISLFLPLIDSFIHLSNVFT